MNLPNAISLARLLAVPIAIWLVMGGHWMWAFWLFVVAGLSDAVDGFLAKRFNSATEIGRYLDPLADKALLVSVYLALGAQGLLPMWLVILVVTRDVLIVGGAILSLMMGRAGSVRPSMLSKVNTVAQIVLIGLALAEAGLRWELSTLREIGVFVIAATTIASGAGYLANWLRGGGRIEPNKNHG